MKQTAITPEKKFIVTPGVYTEYYVGTRAGFWLKEWVDNVPHPYYCGIRFYDKREDAESGCKLYREKYRKEIALPKAGDTVWFMYENRIHVDKVLAIANSGDENLYKMETCDKYFYLSSLFKSKKELIDDLESNIRGNI